MTIHSFPRRVASPALIRAPSAPSRIWPNLAAPTQVQVAQLLAALLGRMDSRKAMMEESLHADPHRP
jgi:hypothetical protein